MSPLQPDECAAMARRAASLVDSAAMPRTGNGASLGTPGPDGQSCLDFNRATNLPCAYTDLATCPLPPPENRLPVAIEAGEKIPVERS